MFLVFAPNKLCGPLCTENFSPEALRGIFAAEGSAMTVPPTPKPACVTKASSAPAPPPPPRHRGAGTSACCPPTMFPPCRRDMGALCPSHPPAGLPHLPKQREKPIAPKPLQNYGAFGGAQVSSQPVLGVHACRAGWLSEDLLPPHQAKVAQQLQVLSFFLFFIIIVFLLSFPFFFLTWPPK